MKVLVEFLKKLNLINDSLKDKNLSIIHPVEEFQRILKRECARADRSSKKFSLLVFDMGCGNEDGSFINFMTTFLSSRVRLSDEVGWINEKDIGILLPDTSPEGAWKLVEEIRQKISLATTSPSCMVYTYPSSEWPIEID